MTEESYEPDDENRPTKNIEVSCCYLERKLKRFAYSGSLREYSNDVFDFVEDHSKSPLNSRRFHREYLLVLERVYSSFVDFCERKVAMGECPSYELNNAWGPEEGSVTSKDPSFS